MALPLYLAMTAAEMGGNPVSPGKFAYMACHFSPYGTGLSNLPGKLPPEAMLILNDRIPICGHNPKQIITQLSELLDSQACECILLDFQRPDSAETAGLAHAIVQALSCPVGVSAQYAERLNCPVFLPPVPPDISAAEYLRPWSGREIWLEAALDGLELTVTEEGCTAAPLPFPHQEEGMQDTVLHCHYRIHTEDGSARFTLFRTREDLNKLLAQAQAHGATRAVGLWQELGG